MTKTAPMTPTSCVLAPACSATGVRDELADMGNPPITPAAALARPTAAISWSLFTDSPRRAANERDSTAVSAKAMSAIPRAGPIRAVTSLQVSPESAGAGSPSGSAPTTGSWSSHPSAATATIEPTTATNRTGKRVPDTLARRIATSDTPPIRAAWGSTRPSEIPSRVRRAPSISESPGTENPNSFGSWPRITTSAIPLR